MKELKHLRERIRQLDKDLLRLIAARMETAKAIGQYKKLAGIPLRDWNVERQVLDRVARQAADFGLPTQVARSVMQTLIAAARAEQERTSFSSYRGAAENILIIGGRGAMGRWFADFFGNQGHRVGVHDVQPADDRRSNAPTLEAALDGTSFALIAVPLDVVPRVIEQLAGLRYGGIVFDIASLKWHLKPAMARARAANLTLTSIHPMFGPDTRTLSDQVICICDCGDAQATRNVEAFFTDTAATLVKLSFDEHDQIISYVLGLSHLTNLVFTKVLMESGKRFEELNKVGSTTFHSQMVTTSTVIQENPDLYYAIQRLNPFSDELCESLKRELETISGWVRNEDRQAFVEMMQAGRQWMTGNDAG
ncbi:MAG: prephenate dehydrogenase/arogenate dehydrogenase family protein [Phycisphaerae bacterium]